MDRNEVMRLAREVGLVCDGISYTSAEQLERFAALVAAECAQVCFDAKNHPDVTPITLGNRILARGKQEKV